MAKAKKIVSLSGAKTKTFVKDVVAKSIASGKPMSKKDITAAATAAGFDPTIIVTLVEKIIAILVSLFKFGK